MAQGKSGAPSQPADAIADPIARKRSSADYVASSRCGLCAKCSEYGKFGWVIDPEGNKIELWQPQMLNGPSRKLDA